MTLWKKSFFLGILMFQSLIFISLFVLNSFLFQKALATEMAVFEVNSNLSEIFIKELASEQTSELVLEAVNGSAENQQFYLEVSENDQVVYATLPPFIDSTVMRLGQNITLVKGAPTLLGKRKEVNFAGRKFTLNYIKDLTPMYQAQHLRIIGLACFGFLMTALLGSLFYVLLKRIYRPLQHLSHELRSPLTVIAGNAELMMRLKTTEEQKINLSSQILKDTSHLQKTIEELLIMGDLQESEIAKKPLLNSKLFEQLMGKYPVFSLDVTGEVEILGNEMLLLRLCDNLLSNAFAASQAVSVVICGPEIIISNQGPEIPEKVLRKLNSGKKLSLGEYQGSGQGFLICREIMARHQGSLVIESDKKQTTVKLTF